MSPTRAAKHSAHSDTRLVLESHGARVGILADDALRSRIGSYLPPGALPSDRTDAIDFSYRISTRYGDGRDRAYRLFLGEECVARTTRREKILEALESDLHFRIATRARDGLFVHAGVVGWQGRAIVLPGRTLSGKSYLVAELLRAGASYYSDEYAVLDADGLVWPYAKPLSLRAPDGSVSRTAVSELGAEVGHAPLPTGLIVLTTYAPDGVWRPHRLTQGQALLALLDNTVVARDRSQYALRVLRRAVSYARAIATTRGDASTVVKHLLDPDAWLEGEPEAAAAGPHQRAAES